MKHTADALKFASGNLLTFRMGPQHYALPIETIVRVIEMVTIAPLPQVDPSVVGVINVNGALVPVVDLRRHLHLPEIPWDLHTPIILIRLDPQTIGLIVDEVLDILELPADQRIAPAAILPATLGQISVLQGLLYHEGATLLILDSSRLFDPQQAGLLAEATTFLTKAPPEPAAENADAHNT